MKIKSFLTAIAMLASLQAMAQNDNVIYDLEEDSTDVTTLKDIIGTQQKVLNTTNVESHINDIWRRRTFFNISYNNATLKSDGKIITECPGDEHDPEVPNNQKEYTFKSDWGVSMQSGHNYRILKKPIANTVDICIDYSWLNLSVNHYKAEADYKFDSSKFYNNNKYCSAWGTEKYEASYSMTLGPSITIAPFVPVRGNAMDHLRLQFYYHIGYGASGVYMLNQGKVDINTNAKKPDDLRISWGHGVVNSFGATIMFKGIGFGYEHRSGNVEYQPINSTAFGKEKNKFNNSFNRIYIQFRS